MKLLSFLSVITCLVFASNFVSAGPKDKQMSYKIDGQTLDSLDGQVRTSEFRNSPVSKRREKGPVATGQRYDEGWLYLEGCHIGGEVGYKAKVINPEWHQTETFKDGSTITAVLIEHTVCDVPPANGRRNYGTWEGEWTVVGGTKRFEGASGSKYQSGAYQNLWTTSRFVSSSYKGVINYDLD